METNSLSTRPNLFLCLILLFIFSVRLSAQVSVSDMFTDNMVLQQNTSVNIWGWASKGERIEINGSWNNHSVYTTADNSGKWAVKLHTPKAKTDGTSYIVSIKGKNEIVLKNVAIGEVWLLSGQSNMELPLKGWGNAPVDNSEEAIAKANYPEIRLIMSAKSNSPVPQKNLSKPSTNVIWTPCSPVSVKEFSALGYFFGKNLYEKLKVPVGLVLSASGGSSCEAWANINSLQKVTDFRGKHSWAPSSPEDNHTPNVLYNSMIAPIVPFTFAGVLWYQGETNVGKAAQFAQLFPAMIEGWRSDFKNPKLPFYYVQICPWGGYGGSSLPELWEAQSFTQKLPNTFMVGTLDLGDSANIHPSHKAPIGYRLALCALARNYGCHILVYSGPQYKSMKVEQGKIRIFFNYIGEGLKITDSIRNQFEIAGDDGIYYPATVEISGNTLLVWSSLVKFPKNARYAWSCNAKATLFNTFDLPSLPFRTNSPNYLTTIQK